LGLGMAIEVGDSEIVAEGEEAKTRYKVLFYIEL